MMIHPRNAWGAKPAKRFTPRRPDSYAGIVVHWFGKPKMALSHTSCPALLRGVQIAHLQNRKEDYSDIAYQYAVCPHGHIYECRGIERQAGANGTGEANRLYAAIVYMAGEGDPLTDPAKDSLTWLIRHLRSLGVGDAVLTHGSITRSSCPGPALTDWVKRKRFDVQPKKPLKPRKPPGLRVDVSAETFELKDQLYDSPAVQARIKRALKSSQPVTIRLTEEV